MSQSPIEYLETEERARSSPAGLKLGRIMAGFIHAGLQNEPQETPLGTAINVLSSLASSIGVGTNELSRTAITHLIVLVAGYLERELVHQQEGGEPHDLIADARDLIQHSNNIIREADPG